LTGSTKPKRRKFIKPTELVFIICFVVVVGLLMNIFISKWTLRRDAGHARVVSDKVINDIQKRDGGAARALGTPTFQKSSTSAGLTSMFKQLEVATLKPPKLDEQFVIDTDNGRTVYFIYKYTALKVPYYIRTAVMNKSGQWQLTGITGNIDESKLVFD